MSSVKRVRLNLLNRPKRSWLDRQQKRVSSASVILETADGRAIVVKANYKAYWTFPGGIVDTNETPRQAAIREVKEEVGIDLGDLPLDFVAVIDRISTIAQTYQFVFSARVTNALLETIVLQASEIDSYEAVSRQDVLSGSRVYGDAVYDWAHARTGYREQVFDH